MLGKRKQELTRRINKLLNDEEVRIAHVEIECEPSLEKEGHGSSVKIIYTLEVGYVSRGVDFAEHTIGDITCERFEVRNMMEALDYYNLFKSREEKEREDRQLKIIEKAKGK